MLSNELEFCLNDAFHQARKARHEFLTVEHLLLAILDTPKVREVLPACGADLDKLKQELRDHIQQFTSCLEEGEEREVQPTLGFQRVLQRAVSHVQSSGKKEVGVPNVLVALFSEGQSQAVHLLNRHHVTRADVMQHIGGKLIASACLCVPTQQQDELVTDLRDFARARELRFNLSEVPTPTWQRIGVILVTPGDNEIWIINTSAQDKFEVSITLTKPEPHWHTYWDELKACMSSRYKWQDAPGGPPGEVRGV